MSTENKNKIRDTLNKVLDEYNKFRVPEAKAVLKTLGEKTFTVEFHGTFCVTCGFYDYFDDLKYELEDHELIADIEKIEELEDGAIVDFVIKKINDK